MIDMLIDEASVTSLVIGIFEHMRAPRHESTYISITSFQLGSVLFLTVFVTNTGSPSIETMAKELGGRNR